MRSGPPPVQKSAVVSTERRMSTADATLHQVQEALKANQGSDLKAIRALLGGDKKLMDRFVTNALTVLSGDNDLLQSATPMSLIQVIKDAASLGLELDPAVGEAAIVVRKGKATLMPMWRGYLKRIRNSREVTAMDCQLVYEHDEFELALGTNAHVLHEPARVLKNAETGEIIQDRGGYLGVYAWALLPTGQYVIEWMDEDEINYVRDTFGNTESKSGRPLPWATSWGEMARKTVIRRLAKRLPGEAVDRLLAQDSETDKIVAEVAAVKDDMIDLRRLAYRAVGAPADDPTDPLIAPGTALEQPQVQPVAPVGTAPETPVQNTFEGVVAE